MPRTTKLASPADFRRTYAEGSRSGGGALIAHVRESESVEPSRIGVTTVKGFRGAVARNRARRRLREVVRAIEESVRPGLDIVLVAGREANTLSFQELTHRVSDALRRAGALHG